jgi:hypothetical protein
MQIYRAYMKTDADVNTRIMLSSSHNKLPLFIKKPSPSHGMNASDWAPLLTWTVLLRIICKRTHKIQQKWCAKFRFVQLKRYFLIHHGFHLNPVSRHVMWQYMTCCFGWLVSPLSYWHRQEIHTALWSYLLNADYSWGYADWNNEILMFLWKWKSVAFRCICFLPHPNIICILTFLIYLT